MIRRLVRVLDQRSGTAPLMRKALRYLTGRRGGSFVTPNTLLTAAGVAWGIIETLQNQAGGYREGRRVDNAEADPMAGRPHGGEAGLAEIRSVVLELR